MPTRYVCPGCGSVTLLPDKAAAMISFNEQIGCGNTSDHEKTEPLVMWEDD